MPKRSNAFQATVFLVKQHFAGEDWVVTESDMLVDAQTGKEREVDINIRGTVGGYSVLIAIECRQHRRSQTMTWVDEMRGKYHERLPTNRRAVAFSHGET
jgi:hypothetical protein